MLSQGITRELQSRPNNAIPFPSLRNWSGGEEALRRINLSSILLIELLQTMAQPSELTDAQRLDFIESGFTIIRGAVPDALLSAAQAAIDSSSNCLDAPPMRLASVSSDVHALLSGTPLKAAVEGLLGSWEELCIRDQSAQIAITKPNAAVGLRDELSNQGWHVDSSHGRFASIASDFLLLVGIAVSDGQENDENRGQLIVFPGSHVKTHQKLGELINDTKHTVQIAHKLRNADLDVGTPHRVLLRRGDAVLAHQRLAHSAGPNGSNTTRTNVYFRVGRRDFPSYAYAYCTASTPWMLFNPLLSLLPAAPTALGKSPMSTRELITLAPTSSPRKALSEEDVALFERQGYVLLKDAVAPRLVEKAARKIDVAMNNGKFSVQQQNGGTGTKELIFNDHVQASTMLTDVLVKSGLVNCAEQLLGEQNVTLLDAKADLHVTQPGDLEGESADAGKIRGGWNVNMGKGRFWRKGADHVLRVVVVLSDGMDNDNRNSVQVVVWPGSHIQIHEMIQDVIAKNGLIERAKAYRQAKRELDCGEPKRLGMHMGDAVFMHQRLASSFSTHIRTRSNMDEVSKMLAFRLQNFNFENDLDNFVMSKLN